MAQIQQEFGNFEVLVHVDMITSHHFCIFVNYTSVQPISRPTVPIIIVEEAINGWLKGCQHYTTTTTILDGWHKAGWISAVDAKFWNLVFENPRRSAFSEIIKPAYLSLTIMTQSKSQRSNFLPIQMFSVNIKWSFWPKSTWFYASHCYHMIDWLDNWINKLVYWCS